MDWFTVDKAGLAKLLERKGKAFAIFELIQNGWDTNAKFVDVKLEAIPGVPKATLSVEDDDPNGFKNLTHAFTLFAESEKKGDPSKRGRFNLGEKLVLALCDEASILSTTGGVIFDANGRHASRAKREKGSVFKGVIRMTRDELAEVEVAIQRLIPPTGCGTTFNGTSLPYRETLRRFEATLPTEAADEEGFLKRTTRKTEVTVHEVKPGETATLYELGIPVVELSGGEPWHVNVHQKIPLNVDRDNVTPAYLQTIRVLLANEMKDALKKEHVDQVWLNAATEDERIESEAVEKVLDERFGKKRAIFDPSDTEANKQLINEGYTIVPGGALSKGQWENVKSSGLARPAGQIRPSAFSYSIDGRMEKVIAPSEYTPGQKQVVDFAYALANKLLGRGISTKIVNEATAMPFAAMWGGNTITFNLGRLGKAWFEEGITSRQLELIIHEFAHDKVHDHLTKEFADEVGRLSAKVVSLALKQPEFFETHGYRA